MYRLTEKERAEARRLLEELLSVASVNGEGREADAAAFLENYFRETGWEMQRQQVGPGRENFILDVPGDAGQGYEVWNGHMDTVPYGDVSAWDTDPSVPSVKEGRIYGRGASDMKGGLAAMAYAFHYIWKKRLRPRRMVRFAATCDEEKGGTGARRFLESGLFGQPDFLLIGEPTNGMLGVAQKGCLWLLVSVKGRTAHGAYPGMGINAAEAGFAFCQQVKELVGRYGHPLLGQATATITRVQAGVADNMVPDAASFVLDIRCVPVISHRELLAQLEELRDACVRDAGGLEIHLSIRNERIPMEIASDHPQVERIRSLAEAVTGRRPDDTGISFFTDASVLAENEPVPVLLFGPGDPALCHRTNESMELKKYFDAIEVYINILTE